MSGIEFAELESVLTKTSKPLRSTRGRFLATGHTGIQQGKVRDNYDLGDRMMQIATDRISTFDQVHPNEIPHKGQVLTLTSLRWFGRTQEKVANHLITADVYKFPGLFKGVESLKGRAMLVEKLDMVPIECVVRGYLAGSGWSEYKKLGIACGVALPTGLVESQRLSEPIFTPATKAETGHDENISFERMCEIVGVDLATQLRAISLDVYTNASDYARDRGIIIADTKFEFGKRADGTVVLADEVLTPDSSRFWDLASYEPGRAQVQFDKQPVRDWAESTGWNKEPPAPRIPEVIVRATTDRYREAYKRLFQ